MRFLLPLLLMSSGVFAAESHWVQIGDGVAIGSSGGTATTVSTQAYIDEANPITETDGFTGYTIRWVLPAPSNDNRADGTSFSYQIVETIVEYNCTTSTARGRRTNLMTLDGVVTAHSGDGWREVPANSGAGIMLSAVKTRVCK